jgi:thiol-disulfide isomerase/thioredoxin
MLAGIAMLSMSDILAAPAASGPSVLAITDKNVHSALLQSETPVLLAFTATWCGHCQQLKPRFNAAAADPYLQGRVTFANIDCESDKPICEEFGVQGYPTVLFVPPNTGSFKAAHAAAQRYAGQRSTQAIRDYLLRVLRKEPLVFLQREFTNGAAAGSGAELAQAHERQYTALSAANFSLKRLIRGLGRDGVVFVLVLPDASSSGDVGGQLAESVDYSSSTAAADSGAHPLVSAAIAAAEKLRAELTVLAVQEQDVHSTPALAAALAPVLALQRSGGLSGKEPLLVQMQAGEARVEVARVGCEGVKGAAAAAAPAGAAQQQTEDVTSPNPQIGVETVRHVPCDPATGIPLSHSRAAGALADAVARWIRTHRFPAVSALSPDNFPLLANNEGTYLAIAVVNETQIAEYRARRDAAPAGGPVLLPPRSALFLTSFEKLAARSSTSLPPSVRAKFLFGFLDAALHAESFLSQFNVSPSDAPQLLVIDIPSKRYWHDRSVFEYEEQESQLEDIASGRAPVHRQGMLAVPQRLINSVGVVPTVAIGALLVVVVAWGVWRLVLAELLGFNAPGAGDAAGGKGGKGSGSGAGSSSNGTGAGRRGSTHSDNMQVDDGSTGPASRRSAGGPPSSRGGASGALAAAAAAAGGLGRAASDRSDMDIDEGGEAFHRVGEHDDDIDGSDEDEDAAGGARRAGEGIRRRAAAAAAAAAALKDSDASDSASEGAPARRPVGRHASRRRVDE